MMHFSAGSLVCLLAFRITNMATNNSTRTMRDRRRGATMETHHEDGDLRADGLWRVGVECCKSQSIRARGAHWTRRQRDFLYFGSGAPSSRYSQTGSKVDPSRPNVLGNPHHHRLRARRHCDTHPSPGPARDTPHDSYAGTLRSIGLDSARDRPPRGAFQLVRMPSDFPHYRSVLDGGRFEVCLILRSANRRKTHKDSTEPDFGR